MYLTTVFEFHFTRLAINEANTPEEIQIMLVPLDSVDILAIVDNEVDPMSPQPAGITAFGHLGHVGFSRGKQVGNGERGEGNVKEAAMELLCCGAHGLSLMLVSAYFPTF